MLLITAKRELNLVLQLSEGFATKLSWFIVLFVSDRCRSSCQISGAPRF